MSRICHQFEVRNVVVKDVVVFVVNYFSRVFEFASEVLFHYPTMFRNELAIFVKNSVSFFIKGAFTIKTSQNMFMASCFFNSVKMLLTKAISLMPFPTIWNKTLNTTSATIDFLHKTYYGWKLKMCQVGSHV